MSEFIALLDSYLQFFIKQLEWVMLFTIIGGGLYLFFLSKGYPLLKIKSKHLSGGQKKKLVISMALINDPSILLLDEPFAALDILTIKMLQEIIVNLQSLEKITVIVCDHQARDLLSCVDRAIVLSNGKIIASGSPSEIIKDSTAKSEYFGNEFKMS